MGIINLKKLTHVQLWMKVIGGSKFKLLLDVSISIIRLIDKFTIIRVTEIISNEFQYYIKCYVETGHCDREKDYVILPNGCQFI